MQSGNALCAAFAYSLGSDFHLFQFFFQFFLFSSDFYDSIKLSSGWFSSLLRFV